MRYRRYYTKINRDGSKTVTSVGPVADAAGWGVRAFLWMAWCAFLVALPWAIYVDAIRNDWGLALAIVAALIWYPIVIAASLPALKRRFKADLAQATRRR